MSVRGGCLCGLVEFEADLPFSKFVRCHCSRCRKATGSAYAANAYVLPGAFRWLSGEAEVARFDLPTARSSQDFVLPKLRFPAASRHSERAEIVVPAR